MSMREVFLRIASATLVGLAFAAVLLGCDQDTPSASGPPATTAPSVVIVQETPSAPQPPIPTTAVSTPVPVPVFTPVAAEPTASAIPEPGVTQAPLETPTAPPTPSPSAVSVPPPAQTPAPQIEPAPAPTSTSIPSTPTPTVDPSVPAHLRHIDLKRLMLELINVERTRAGLQPVVMGDNAAAQLHAEAALEGCFSSHWGLDGLKPFMRYSLAGGYQSSGENVHGSDYCITDTENYRPITNVEEEVREAVEGWMDSPGHRRNILRPKHRRVNIGLAWDRYNLKAVQQFEGDYVEYEGVPTLENGILTMSGKMKNGVQFQDERDLLVRINYDPPPRQLTLGQVSRTYCSRNGLHVANLRPPETGDRIYFRDEITRRVDGSACPDPYEVSADAPAARSHEEARALWQGGIRRQPETGAG